MSSLRFFFPLILVSSTLTSPPRLDKLDTFEYITEFMSFRGSLSYCSALKLQILRPVVLTEEDSLLFVKEPSFRSLVSRCYLNFSLHPSLAKIRDLDLSHQDFFNPTDLSFILSLVPNLRNLNLSSTGLSSLEPLSGFTALMDLDISGNPSVTSLAPLAEGVYSLKFLNISGTGIDDIELLAGAAHLHTLNIDHTAITNFQPIANMHLLRTLSLRNTQIELIEFAQSVPQLTDLDVAGSFVSEIPASLLNQLRTLDVSNTPLEETLPHGFDEVSPLSTLASRPENLTLSPASRGIKEDLYAKWREQRLSGKALFKRYLDYSKLCMYAIFFTLLGYKALKNALISTS